MPVTDSPFTERAATLARQLALAAHWGLEDVPYRSAPPAPSLAGDEPEFLALPAAQDPRFNLEPFADLLGHSCTSPAGVLGLPLRLLRSFFKFVLGPWLDMQTLFNRAVLKTLLHDQASSRTYLEQLARHVRNQQDEVEDLYSRLARREHELEALRQAQRLSVRHVVVALEQSCGRSGVAPAHGGSVSARAMEQVFVQTWLPRPPARLLVHAGDDGDGLELAALGYEVAADSGLTVEPSAQSSRTDALFDGVVCLAHSAGGRQLFDGFHRLLRPGGRVVVAVPLDDTFRHGDPAPTGFRLLQTAFAVGGGDWTYTSDAAVVESLRARGPVDGVALIAAEKN